MERVRYINDTLNNCKFILKEEYKGFGIYQEKTPSDYFVNQSWLIYNGEIGIRIESYNHYCKEEVLDLIDYYNEHGLFDKHGYQIEKNLFGIHPNNRSCYF